MGTYYNPGNKGFQKILQSEYVDKTGLIALINKTIGTTEMLTCAIYNPYSVMQAMRKRKFGSYWKKTSAAESLMTYINMDFEGLQEIVSRLISGEEIEVDTEGFENDFETFKSRDDVLTLLIHLGYLTWHEEDGTARIPNEEVRAEFRKILKEKNNNLY